MGLFKSVFKKRVNNAGDILKSTLKCKENFRDCKTVTDSLGSFVTGVKKRAVKLSKVDKYVAKKLKKMGAK